MHEFNYFCQVGGSILVNSSNNNVFFFAANARDNVVKDNFPLKQEGCEQPQAQGDGAGKCEI